MIDLDDWAFVRNGEEPIELPTELLAAIGWGSILATATAMEAVSRRGGAPPRNSRVLTKNVLNTRTPVQGDRRRCWPEIDHQLAIARGIAVLKLGGIIVLELREVKVPT